jgi:hypothetical protein
MEKASRLRDWQQRKRPTREYTLPSSGWLYGDKLPGGVVEMTAIGGIDEETIAGAGEGAAAMPVLREKLSHLVNTGALPFNELLFSDFIALLFHYFAFSYGADMHFAPKCPHCREIPREPITRYLDELPCRVYEDDPTIKEGEFREPFVSQELPPWGDTIQYKLLRVQDMVDAEDYMKKAAAAGMEGDFMRSYATAKSIMGVNGEEVNLFLALDWVKNATTGETLRILREEISAQEPGYDMNIELTCPNPRCGATFSVRLPEDGSFFRLKNTQHRVAKAAKVLNDELRTRRQVLPGMGGDDAVAEGGLHHPDEPVHRPEGGEAPGGGEEG